MNKVETMLLDFPILNVTQKDSCLHFPFQFFFLNGYHFEIRLRMTLDKNHIPDVNNNSALFKFVSNRFIISEVNVVIKCS